MKAILGYTARFVPVVISIFTLTLLGTSVGWAQQKSLKEQLVGPWTMVSTETISKDGKKSQSFGPKPTGILILDASGRYALVYGRPDRPKLKAGANVRADTAAAELGEAARAFGANFGTWSVNEADKTLIRKYEIALIPNNDKQELKESVTLSKDELKLARTSAEGAKTELLFRRTK
jgi:hypothetical protein